MFILIKAEHGILSGDNSVTKHELHRDAWLDMCRQVDEERALYEDYDHVSSEERTSYDGFDMTNYGVDHNHAFVSPEDGPEWHIFEV